jgi:hypothetical protein
MTEKDLDNQDTPPKERRTAHSNRQPRALMSGLTHKEWSFLNAASNALNKTISVLYATELRKR